MGRVAYMVPMQGFRPYTNPGKALAGIGLRGLGDSNAFSGCVQGYDANSNPVPCGDPGAAVWMDANGNAVPAGTLAAAPGGSMPTGGAATGSLLLYQGQWQVTPTLNVNTIISRVSQAIRSYGLQVVNSQNDGGAFTVGNFNVMLTLQVTGGGYGQPLDAGSMVDHAYYSVVGRMPVFSSTTLQSAPGSPVPSLISPTASASATPAAPQTLTQWFESNAWLIGLGIVAAVVLPKVL